MIVDGAAERTVDAAYVVMSVLVVSLFVAVPIVALAVGARTSVVSFGSVLRVRTGSRPVHPG